MARNQNTAQVVESTEVVTVGEGVANSKKDITTSDLSTATSKSAKMRLLKAEGFSTGEIAKHLGVKYQFVRNVLVADKARQVA